jgi:hypothetical protein
VELQSCIAHPIRSVDLADPGEWDWGRLFVVPASRAAISNPVGYVKFFDDSH